MVSARIRRFCIRSRPTSLCRIRRRVSRCTRLRQRLFRGSQQHGYAPFQFDISDFLELGAKNYIVARVDASFGDGWFYEGAGIYRHVWLTKTDALHLGKWDSTVRSSLSGTNATLTLGTVVLNEGKESENAKVSWQIVDATGRPVATVEAPAKSVPVDGAVPFTAMATLDSPALWSVDEPNLYSAIVTVSSGATPRDGERINFGIRTAMFDAEKASS